MFYKKQMDNGELTIDFWSTGQMSIHSKREGVTAISGSKTLFRLGMLNSLP